MARIRLTVGLRDSLKLLAKQTVDPAVERDALNAAYAKAAPLVRAVVEKTFPPKDMKVCKKYGSAFIDDCIKLRLPGLVIDQFVFAGNAGPLVAKKTYSGQIYDADPDTASAVLAWLDATKAYEAEKIAPRCLRRPDRPSTNCRCGRGGMARRGEARAEGQLSCPAGGRADRPDQGRSSRAQAPLISTPPIPEGDPSPRISLAELVKMDRSAVRTLDASGCTALAEAVIAAMRAIEAREAG